jgi:3-hydroxyacyl-[acyl-carrier-protein] dehydratase
VSRTSRMKREALVKPALMQKLGTWRHPFQMVDRITDFARGPKGFVVAIKNVTMTEPHFLGHFPDYPVMPGVLIAECLGQTSHYLTQLNQFCCRYEEINRVTLDGERQIVEALHSTIGERLATQLTGEVSGFLTSHELRFKHFVVPGDVLELHSCLMMSDDNGFHHYDVKAYVGNEIACEGRLVNYRRTVAHVVALMSTG